MPTKRLTMRRIHRLMTLHFGAGAGTRVIARELGISHSTVREYLARIAAAGITWPLPVALAGDTHVANQHVRKTLSWRFPCTISFRQGLPYRFAGPKEHLSLI